MTAVTTFYSNQQAAVTASGLPAAGLRLHLRPDQGLLRATNGTLAEWQDQSGSAAVLRPGAGQLAPATVAWAGGQGVYLDGSQHFELLRLNGPAPAVYTVAVVLQKRAGADRVMPLAFGADQEHAHDLWFAGNAFGLNTFSDDLYGIAPAEAALSQPVLVIAEIHSADVNRFRLWINGQPQPLAAWRAPFTNRPLDATFSLGASGYRNNGEYNWEGWLGEVALYDRVLGPAEHAQLRAAIMQRYPLLLAHQPTLADVPPTPVGWWRADSGRTHDPAGRLTRWADCSGHGLDLLPDPALTMPSVQAWAGGEALYFDGQSAPAQLDWGGPAPAVLTVALVLQKQAGASNTMPVGFGNAPGFGQDLWVYNDCFGLNTYQTDITGITGAEALLSQPVLVMAELHSTQPAAFRLWLNGQAQTVGPVLNSPAAPALDSVFRVGGNTFRNNGDYFWRGWLGEVLLYNRLLTDAEHAQLMDYLRRRYQVPN
jgi:hypothetical protein